MTEQSEETQKHISLEKVLQESKDYPLDLWDTVTPVLVPNEINGLYNFLKLLLVNELDVTTDKSALSRACLPILREIRFVLQLKSVIAVNKSDDVKLPKKTDIIMEIASSAYTDEDKQKIIRQLNEKISEEEDVKLNDIGEAV
jgi:hypothetical protein